MRITNQNVCGKKLWKKYQLHFDARNCLSMCRLHAASKKKQKEWCRMQHGKSNMSIAAAIILHALSQKCVITVLI